MLKTTRKGKAGIAVYALLYDGRFVGNTISFQLRTAAEQLVSGRKAMTLFMASHLNGSVDNLDAAPATRILLAAIDSFQSRQPGASRGTPSPVRGD